jgi:hypothetical protein
VSIDPLARVPWEATTKVIAPPGRPTARADLKHQDLETKLVKVHAIAAKATRLRKKYLRALAYDDKEREHIAYAQNSP